MDCTRRVESRSWADEPLTFIADRLPLLLLVSDLRGLETGLTVGIATSVYRLLDSFALIRTTGWHRTALATRRSFVLFVLSSARHATPGRSRCSLRRARLLVTRADLWAELLFDRVLTLC